MSRTVSVAICDDDETLLSIIAGVVQGTFAKEEVEIETFPSAKKLWRRMGEKGFDLLFLDIDMPEVDGIQLGMKLRSERRNVDIVYVSEREDRVFESFKVHPFGFVRKRNFLKDIRAVIKLWLDNRSAEPADKFVIEGSKGSIAVGADEIVYIESMKKIQLVHLTGTENAFEASSSLEKFAEELSGQGFLQPHKSFLVNYLFIRHIGDAAITLTTGEEIPVSRRRLTALREEYMRLMQRKTPLG